MTNTFNFLFYLQLKKIPILKMLLSSLYYFLFTLLIVYMYIHIHIIIDSNSFYLSFKIRDIYLDTFSLLI